MKKIMLLMIILLPSLALAQGINISSNTTYHFDIGKEAIIPLQVISNLSTQGMLTYTVREEIRQGSYSFYSTNTRSISINIPEGNYELPLSFGVQDQPKTFYLDLSITTNNNPPQKTSINNIKVIIGSGSSPSQQQTTQQQSTQSKQSYQPTVQQKQDTNTLKEQIKQDLSKQQAIQNELNQNQELLKEHQKLLDEGYQQINSNAFENNNATEFDLEYQMGSGEKARITGKYSNNELQELTVQKQTPDNDLLDKLRENKQFREYEQELANKGYQVSQTTIQKTGNKTKTQVDYKKNNKIASITAEINNNKVDNVKLHKQKNYWWIILLLIPLLIFSGIKTFKRPKQEVKQEVEEKQEEFSIRKHCLKLLSKANKIFPKDQKQAFALVARSIREYVAYQNNINQEITNNKIISLLDENFKEPIIKALQTCDLVEFAKYKASKEEFEKIVNTAKQLINKR